MCAAYNHGQIETWIFDLDDTLYPPEAGLLSQINQRMTDYIVRELGREPSEASEMRARYWQRYGITLAGLIEDHDVDAGHFLADTHDIDLSGLRPDPALHAALGALSGRLVVHTNGSREHADRVLDATGLGGFFEDVIALEDKALIPKPRAEAYATVLDRTGADPKSALMIEDTVGNLTVPHGLGMTTVWLTHDPVPPTPAHVDHRITDLAAFLRRHSR